MKQLLHTPEGVRDIYNGEMARKLKIEAAIRETMHLYGYKDIQPPTFEFFDIFKKERGSVDSSEMFKFFDRNNNTLVLRPDMTPSVVRCAAKYFAREDLPVRFCYMGNIVINNSSYRGRLKETTDAGVELIGDGSRDADAEIVALVIECLLKCGLKEFKIDVGHAGFLEGLFEEAHLSQEVRREIEELLLNKNFFALDSRVRSLKLPEPLEQVFGRLKSYNGSVRDLQQTEEYLHNEKSCQALDSLVDLYRTMEQYGYQDYLSFDLGMVGEYKYYTGIIFNGYTYGTGDGIVSGGRYDTLMGQFGPQAPSVGFKISVDGLMSAMSRQNISVDAGMVRTAVLYESAGKASAFALAKSLRGRSVPVILLPMQPERGLEGYRSFAGTQGLERIYYLEDSSGIVTQWEPESDARMTRELVEIIRENGREEA